MKSSLGVEFYRNYIGIEKPLRLDFGNPDDSTIGFDYIDSTDNENQISAEEYWWSYGDIKPHLKLPEDLTDEEWLWVFCGEDMQDDHGIRRGYSEAIIELIWDFGSYKSAVCKFDYSDNYFSQCNQEVLNRLYSLHSHPKAKEYIEKGLAIKIEVK